MIKVKKITPEEHPLFYGEDFICLLDFYSFCQFRVDIKSFCKQYPEDERYKNYFIEFKKTEIRIDKNGNLSYSPKGFFDFHVDRMFELL